MICLDQFSRAKSMNEDVKCPSCQVPMDKFVSLPLIEVHECVHCEIFTVTLYKPSRETRMKLGEVIENISEEQKSS